MQKKKIQNTDDTLSSGIVCQPKFVLLALLDNYFMNVI